MHLISTASRNELSRIEDGSAIGDLAFSPDGELLAAASSDGSARLISTVSGREVARLEQGKDVTDVAFSPDGRYFATASDGTARLIATGNRQEITRVTHDEIIYGVGFSPNSKFLVTVPDTMGAVAYLVSTESGKEVAEIEHDDFLTDIAFSPDGMLLATASNDGAVFLGDLSRGGWVARIAHAERIREVLFSPDSRYLATNAGPRKSSSSLRIFATQTGGELATFYPGGQHQGFAFSPDSKSFATGDSDGFARIFRDPHGFEVARIVGASAIRSVNYNPNGHSLAARDETGAWLAEFPSGKVLAQLAPDDRANAWMRFSPDGRFLAIFGRGIPVARLIDAGTGRELAQVVHQPGVSRVAFSPGGAHAAYGSPERISLVETGSGRIVAELQPGSEAFGFSSDGRLFASHSEEQLQIWSMSSYDEVKRLTFYLSDDWAELSPDFRFIGMGRRYTGTIKLLAANGDRGIATVQHGKHAWLEFSRDGRFLATGSNDGSASLLATETGQELTRLTHEGPPIRTEFSSNGAFLATLSEHNDGWLVDTAGGKTIAHVRMQPPPEDEYSDSFELVFSPLSRYVTLGQLARIMHRGWRV